MSEKKVKERLDILVVKTGIASTREKAQSLILAGRILSGDRLLEKPGMKIEVDTVLRLKGDSTEYVSRGAYKLKAAIESFQIQLKEKICLDIGASTGGFTQICLEWGASIVFAVDVGHNQLDWKLRSHPKVISLEGTNIRSADASIISRPIDFICIDCSFISLKLVLPHALRFCKNNTEIVALIKPQHEVGRDQVGKGGIVRDQKLHELVKEEISAYSQSIGFNVLGLIESPIRGTTGNVEFLIYLKLSDRGVK